jgi:C-terminal processing protease CtpA/Prc
MKVKSISLRCLALLAFFNSLVAPAFSQLSGFDRQRAQSILEDVASDIRKEYYDPKFHAVNWDAKVAEAKAGIAKANTWNAAMIEIAVLTDFLDDSHTHVFPPYPEVRTDYGWTFQLFGDRCYVTRVRPKSDAESKGLKPGDEILAINQVRPTRFSLPKISYALGALSQQSSLHVTVKNQSGSTRTLDVAAKVKLPQVVRELDHPYGLDLQYYRLGHEDYEHRMRAQTCELGDSLMIFKLPGFFLSESEIEKIVDKARRHSALVVDLRSNPGGAVESLQYLLGGVFDHEVKIADKTMRSKTAPMTTKNHRDPFTGKLIVLVDSGSSSAAELFARVVQIEKRGTVIGDRSSGLVMESRTHPRSIGVPPIYYSDSITEADLIMADGKSLEHIGVTPDETILPAPSDLAEGLDPVLARAAELAAVKLTPEEAGKLFPYEWPGAMN